MSDFECSLYYLINSKNSLALSNYKCGDKFNLINLYNIFFTILNSNILLFVLVVIFYVIVCFILLSKTSDIYLSESLSNLTEKLRIPESIAAMTLLAFANSAPDLITSLLQGGGDEGPLIGIIQLIGAMIFSTLLSLSFIIYRSKTNIVLQKYIISKEFVFYFICICSLFLFSYIGYINYAMIISFFMLYVIYLITSIYIINKYDKPDEKEIQLADYNINIDSNNTEIKKNDGDSEESLNIENIKKENIYSIQNVSMTPIRFMWKLTIPNADNPFMSIKLLRPIVMFTSSMFIFYTFKMENLLLLLIISTVVALIDLLTNIVIKFPTFNFFYREFFVIFASIAYIFIGAQGISDVLFLISINFKISEFFLSGVVLSIGNTLGDFFANSSLSAIGKGKMASYGTFSCQLFNFFMGFGLGIIFSLNSSDNNGRYKFNIFDNFFGPERNKKIFVLIFLLSAILSILSTFIYLLFNNFTLKKNYSLLLLIGYMIFLTLVGIMEFKFKII